MTSSPSSVPPDLHKQAVETLVSFYQRLVCWRCGLEELSELQSQWDTLHPNLHWIDAFGNINSSNQSWMYDYGDRSTFLTYALEVVADSVQEETVYCSQNDNPEESDEVAILIASARVLERSLPLDDNNDETVDSLQEQTHEKQVSAVMMRRGSSSSNWILQHLQETWIEGKGPRTNEPPTSTTVTEAIPPSPPWMTQPSLASRRRHIHANVAQYHAKPLLWEGQLVGISIRGWDIGTSQGPIGDARWFAQSTEICERLAQFRYTNVGTTNTTSNPRQLVLPEMVFPLAHVVFERRPEVASADLFVSWDAMDCLQEWAECHQAIPMPTGATAEQAPDKTLQFRGVSIMETSDANLWKHKLQTKRLSSNSESSAVEPGMHEDNRQRPQQLDCGEPASSIVTNITFHYDWTYSTPFCGKVYGSKSKGWKPTETSQMPMQLLMDQSIPILYFDDVVLMEDDLHDNGLSQYTVKVRVMPTCAYLLGRLFVRVDHVLIRIRETRLLVDFDAEKLYRDVKWKEVAWKELDNHSLPTDVRAWTTEQQSQGAVETSAFQRLLQQVPPVEVPDGVWKHAELSYSPKKSSQTKQSKLLGGSVRKKASVDANDVLLNATIETQQESKKESLESERVAI